MIEAAHPTGKPGVALARLLLGVAMVLAGVAADQLGEAETGHMIWVLAVVVLPLAALPALMVCVIRMGLPFGGLNLCDVIATAYLVRLTVSGSIMNIRFAPSQAALAAFFAWAVLVTSAHGGTFWSLVHLMLYAAVGIGLTHSPTARRGLLWAVLGLGVYQVVVHLPNVTDRLYGLMADPAQVGALLLAALLLGPISALPLGVRLLLRSLLVIGVVATQTRSIWFALVAVVVAAALPRRWYLPGMLPLILAPVGLLIVPRLTTFLGLNRESGLLREEAIQVGLRQFGEQPLTGHGWAVLDHLDGGGTVYNLWVHLGVATGIVGILLFLAYIVLLSAETSRARSSAYLFLAGILAMSLTETPLYGDSVVTLLFFTVISSAVRARPFEEACHRAVPGISRPGRPSSLGAPPPAHGLTAQPGGPDRAGVAPARPEIPQATPR
ncbi:hypothetical protein GCM10020216_092310 [Nonomuraea helvata]